MQRQWSIFFLWIFLFIVAPSLRGEESKHFVVVIPSYNNEEWVKRNLDSVASQTYTNWSIIYIDDCSTDRTPALVKQFIETHHLQNKCALIENTKRRLGLANIYDAIHSCQPRDIIVLLDGDDWLAHNKVFEKLARVYANERIWLTYGNFQSSPAGWGSCAAWIPLAIRQSNSFRQHPWVAVHLRTFYAKLFHMIRKEDLELNGQFFTMTHDMAVLFPMLEMASKNHFSFIREVLYVYNVANPIMDWRVNAQLQRDLDTYIRSLPPYQPLDRLF